MKRMVTHQMLLLVLGFCLLSFFTVNAEASGQKTLAESAQNPSSEEKGLPTLTLEEGLERVLARSSRLKEVEHQFERIEVLRDRSSETLRYTRPYGRGFNEEDQRHRNELLRYLQYESNRKTQRSHEDYLEALLEWELKTAFADLTLLKDQQDLMQLSLKHEEHMLVLAEHKLENGLIHRGKLERMRRSKQQMIEEKNRLDQEIDVHYRFLNQMMGFPADYRYLVEWESEEEENWNFPDPTLQARRVRSRDPYLEQMDQDIEMGKWSLSLYTYNVGEEPYKAKEIDVQILRNKRSQVLENLERLLAERIASAEDLVIQSRQLQLKKEGLQDRLLELELLLEAGLVRPAELTQARLDIKKAAFELHQNQYQIHYLSELIKHPYYVPDYVN